MLVKIKMVLFVLLFAAASCQTAGKEMAKGRSTDELQQSYLPGLPEISFRGIFATNPNTIFVSGAKGNIWKTLDGGKTWLPLPAPDNDSLDFRDIEVLEDSIVLIMSAGFPSRIYRSLNGGERWTEVYSHPDSLAFMDGMDFNENGFGVVFGDVLNGSFLVLASKDKGEKWQGVLPKLLPLPLNSEAGFAASGSSVQLLQNDVFIGTGGDGARLIVGNIYGKSWQAKPTPMMQGTAGRGIYSLAFKNKLEGVAVGGAWNEDSIYNSIIRTRDGGEHWNVATAIQHYRSSVAYLGSYTYLACGPKGLDISMDDGKNWKRLSEQPFHSIHADSSLKVAFAVGNTGILARIQL